MSILRQEYNFNPLGISDIPDDVSMNLFSESESEDDFDPSIFEDDDNIPVINKRMLIIGALHDIIHDQIIKIEKLQKDRKVLKENIQTLKNLLTVSKDPYIINVIKYF